MSRTYLISNRIINASRDAIRSEDPVYKGQVASGGMVAMALLEVADALERQNKILEPKPHLDPWWKIRLRNRRDWLLNKMTAKL